MGRLVAAGVMVSLALLSAMAQAQSSERALMSKAVERSMLQETVHLDGVIEAVQQSTVSAQTSGTVRSLPFDVDDSVAAGDLIVQLEDSEQRSRLRQAEAGLEEAEAALADAGQRFERIEAVHERGLVSRQEFDQARNNLAAARARVERARAVAWQITRYSFGLGVCLAMLFAALAGVLPRLFTNDAAVLAQIPHAWWLFVAQQPVAGIVFALDGVLLGAADTRFLRTTTLACALGAFLPLIWLSWAFGWGLAGIWVGLTMFLVTRMVAVVWRTRTDHWLVAGA